MPVILTPRPARRGSTPVAAAPRPRPITPAEAGRLMRQAERDPRLDVEACAVLRVLLFDFTTWRTGHCAPSLEALARRAKLSRSTVIRRLAVLSSAGVGLLRRVRRAILVGAAAGWRGVARWCQATTAYHFAEPPPAPLHSGCQAEPPTSNQEIKKPGQARPGRADEALEAALARLGRAVAARAQA